VSGGGRHTSPMLRRMQEPFCVLAFSAGRVLAIPAVVAVFAATGSASGAVQVVASQTAGGRAPQATVGAQGIPRMHELETQVLVAINDLRRRQGVVPLRLSRALAVAASQHSLSMAEHGFFEHASLDGSPFSKRVEAAYPNTGSRWAVGENMVWASPGLTARQALELWLSSPVHRDNLLSPAWREIGLGAVHAFVAGGVYDGRDVTILTADFGVRR
jgi:uncharacterized protein YkwD